MDHMLFYFEQDLEEMKSELRDVKAAKSALKEFKSNQVEIFKGYLEGKREGVIEREPERRADLVRVNYTDSEQDIHITMDDVIASRFGIFDEILIEDTDIEMMKEIASELIDANPDGYYRIEWTHKK